VAVIEPHSPRAKAGRPPLAIETMLRIHYLLPSLSDPAMEAALHDTPPYCEFAAPGAGAVRLPDESTIMRFHHLLEALDLIADMLRVVNDIRQAEGVKLAGTAVDAMLVAAASSTKDASHERDPEMTQIKEGNNWYSGTKAHMGVDANLGQLHTVADKAAKTGGLNIAGALPDSLEKDVFADVATKARTSATGPGGQSGTWRCDGASAAS